jgi:hypothetical protein
MSGNAEWQALRKPAKPVWHGKDIKALEAELLRLLEQCQDMSLEGLWLDFNDGKPPLWVGAPAPLPYKSYPVMKVLNGKEPIWVGAPEAEPLSPDRLKLKRNPGR